jgi:hypothetical protein
LDIALKKWFHSFKITLEKINGFDKNDIYYYMPRTTLYILGSTTLKQYMRITREKRTGSYKLIRNCIIFFEYLSFQVAKLSKLTRRKITLPVNENYFAIFVGNHRIRLSSISFDNDLVIDLTESKPGFNISAAHVVDSCFSSLSPNQCVLDDEYRVLSEERFTGVAINRLAFNSLKEAEITFLSNYRDCLLPNLRNVNVNEFVKKIRATIFNLPLQQQLKGVAKEYDLNEFNTLVSELLESLCSEGPDELSVSPAHRDLNRGNVLACEGFNLRVIDWEFLGWAYYNYDIFIFLSNYRHSQDFGASWDRYTEESSRFGIEVQRYEVLIFALEEVIFFIDNYSVREWKNIRDFKVLIKSLNHASEIINAT